ncbi:histidine kinase [Chitinophaga pendula]|uniref:sensor histidine kinase n=1 Tax=Chitinophaga TaxID=79328 RepID=UPI000BB044D1|nr:MULTISPECIES: histidine kinase [Chitinophaga]ASZ12482.1 histidine kinase [Chitinophaga sp. MD30]UCJ09916.1 histidine kinase [Chitinophaga pendula]
MLYQGTLSRKKELIIHLLFWLLAAYFTFVKNPFHAQLFVPDLFYTTYVVVFMGTFYFHYLLVMKQVFRRFAWSRLLAGLFISYLFFTGLRWLTEQVITDWLFNRVNYTETTFLNYMLDNMHYSSMPILFSSFLWFGIYSVRLLEYNKAILEENKNTEIKFLKAQINPHFIFNTLNNIYAMIYFQSDKSLLAVEKLSQIMRFSTYESQKERIKLQDEVNYIKAYIELEQLRHPEGGTVNFTSGVENDYMEVPPYILSPLVENALKHGILSAEASINMWLDTDGEQLRFRVDNEMGVQKKDKLGGIGLDNLKKRLEIYYPGCHQLQLKTEHNRFIAELSIKIA